jgi:D-3-phosphoglycerate dehydrogenase
VNTGRGKCIVEEDVAEALRSGKLAGYATDVYANEPPEPNNPLLSAPNTLLTPHIGASSKENLLRIGEEVVKILAEYTGKRA